MTFEDIARRFDRDAPGWKWANDPKKYIGNARRLAAHFKPSGKIADVGAGPGFLARIVRANYGSYHGFDERTDELVQSLREINRADVSPFVLSPERSELGDTFDAVVCGWITFGEYWSREDWSRVLSSFFRALNPGGVLVLRFVYSRPDGFSAALPATAGFARTEFDGLLGLVFKVPGGEVLEAREGASS